MMNIKNKYQFMHKNLIHQKNRLNDKIAYEKCINN